MPTKSVSVPLPPSSGQKARLSPPEQAHEGSPRGSAGWSPRQGLEVSSDALAAALFLIRTAAALRAFGALCPIQDDPAPAAEQGTAPGVMQQERVERPVRPEAPWSCCELLQEEAKAASQCRAARVFFRRRSKTCSWRGRFARQANPSSGGKSGSTSASTICGHPRRFIGEIIRTPCGTRALPEAKPPGSEEDLRDLSNRDLTDPRLPWTPQPIGTRPLSPRSVLCAVRQLVSPTSSFEEHPASDTPNKYASCSGSRNTFQRLARAFPRKNWVSIHLDPRGRSSSLSKPPLSWISL